MNWLEKLIMSLIDKEQWLIDIINMMPCLQSFYGNFLPSPYSYGMTLLTAFLGPFIIILIVLWGFGRYFYNSITKPPKIIEENKNQSTN